MPTKYASHPIENENHYNFPKNGPNISLSAINSEEERDSVIPEHYNFFVEYPFCKTLIFDQKKCSNCYALATASTISHRFCKKTGDLYHLNPHDLIYCDYFSCGCFEGGHEYLSWRYIQYNGLPNISCQRFQQHGPCNYTSK